MTKDRVTGLFAFLLGCLVVAATRQLPSTNMAGDIGPQVFPYISAGLLIFCGGGLIITGSNKEKQPYFTKKQFGRLVLIFAAMTLYCILLCYIGYVISTFLAAFALCTMFGKQKQISWWKSLIFAVLLTGVLYVSFVHVFSIQLPSGKLF